MKNARKILKTVRARFGSENVGSKTDFIYGNSNAPIFVVDGLFDSEFVEIYFNTSQLTEDMVELVAELTEMGLICQSNSFVSVMLSNFGGLQVSQSAFNADYDPSKTYFVDRDGRNISFRVSNA
jgi:hypothetical protein